MGQVRTQALNSSNATSEWIDLSVPIYGGMVHWPDDPAIELDAIMHVERGDVCTVSALKMGTHTGTHIDGPIHFLPGSPGTDAVPLENLIGPARVIEIEDSSAVRWAELRKHKTLAVGIDYLSLGSPEVHRTLLRAGVGIIEGLNLSTVSTGEYEFLCLPLRIPGGDGAPARALLKPLG